jgi:hypothetical protein
MPLPYSATARCATSGQWGCRLEGRKDVGRPGIYAVSVSTRHLMRQGCAYCATSEVFPLPPGARDRSATIPLEQGTAAAGGAASPTTLSRKGRRWTGWSCSRVTSPHSAWTRSSTPPTRRFRVGAASTGRSTARPARTSRRPGVVWAAARLARRASPPGFGCLHAGSSTPSARCGAVGLRRARPRGYPRLGRSPGHGHAYRSQSAKLCFHQNALCYYDTLHLCVDRCSARELHRDCPLTG